MKQFIDLMLVDTTNIILLLVVVPYLLALFLLLQVAKAYYRASLQEIDRYEIGMLFIVAAFYAITIPVCIGYLARAHIDILLKPRKFYWGKNENQL